jgi:hypothetical protein
MMSSSIKFIIKILQTIISNQPTKRICLKLIFFLISSCHGQVAFLFLLVSVLSNADSQAIVEATIDTLV